MSRTLRYAAAVWTLCAVPLSWTAGCLDAMTVNNGTSSDGGNPDSTLPQTDAGKKDASPMPKDGAGSADGPDASDAAAPDGDGGLSYVLIDDMETTTHGPIELAGINAPMTPGYWFNFGASRAGDTADPPIMAFTFSALSSPTTTLNGHASMHAAHQICSLNGQYDVCGLGFEFAQVPDPDAGVGGDAGFDAMLGDAGRDGGDAGRDAGDAGHDGGDDAGDAGPAIPRVTVPFDISQYQGIVFWGKAATDGGTVDIKVQFPDTDTDPRGGVCNSAAAGASGPTDTSQCYNSYSVHVMFTGDWQEFTVLLSDLKLESFGFPNPGPWDGKKVYGIGWQGQKNSVDDAGAEGVDFWVDDVYFIR